MVNLIGGSEQIISMILKITKAKVGLRINKDKSIGRMNKLGKMFRLYWKNVQTLLKEWVVEKSG